MWPNVVIILFLVIALQNQFKSDSLLMREPLKTHTYPRTRDPCGSIAFVGVDSQSKFCNITLSFLWFVQKLFFDYQTSMIERI